MNGIHDIILLQLSVTAVEAVKFIEHAFGVL